MFRELCKSHAHKCALQAICTEIFTVDSWSCGSIIVKGTADHHNMPYLGLLCYTTAVTRIDFSKKVESVLILIYGNIFIRSLKKFITFVSKPKLQVTCGLKSNDVKLSYKLLPNSRNINRYKPLWNRLKKDKWNYCNLCLFIFK